MRTIAIAHHKGGTAKTTTTVNLAAALAESGHRVLVIDMDPQGSATAWLGVRDPEYSVIDAIRGRKNLADLIYETTAPGVQLVPASPGLVVSERDDETNTALGFIRAMERLPPLWDFVFGTFLGTKKMARQGGRHAPVATAEAICCLWSPHNLR